MTQAQLDARLILRGRVEGRTEGMHFVLKYMVNRFVRRAYKEIRAARVASTKEQSDYLLSNAYTQFRDAATMVAAYGAPVAAPYKKSIERVWQAIQRAHDDLTVEL